MMMVVGLGRSVGLRLNTGTDGHALDLVDVEAVGLDVDLRLKLQPGLLKRRVAVSRPSQVSLQLVDVLDQVLSFSIELGVDVVSHKFDARTLLPLLYLLLAGGQGSLLGSYGSLQALDALLHLPDLDDGLGQLLLQELLGSLVLVNSPPVNDS